MKKFCGNLPEFPLKLSNRLSFRMPEVPLTKSCLEEHSQLSEVTKSEDDSLRSTINEQKEAVKGLSLWYTNHLSAMYAIQKHKDVRNEKARRFTRDLHKPSIFDIQNSFKVKQQPLGPHIDLENYLNSLKSRQKEMRNFGKRNKVWDKYFEKAIPGWNELKQSNKIYPSLMNKITTKTSTLHKLSSANKAKRKSSLLDPYSSLEFLHNPPPSRASEQSIQSSASKSLQRLSKLKYSQVDQVATTPANLENKIRDYFLNSAAVKNEQMGNINNEILFNHVYGKYFTQDELKEIDKRKKRKPKQHKRVVSADVLFAKKLPEERNNDDNENSRESLKHIEGLIKSKQKELDSLLRDMDNSRSKNESITRIKNNSRNRSKSRSKPPFKLELNESITSIKNNTTSRNRSKSRSKPFNLKLSSSKRSSSVLTHRGSTPMYLDVPKTNKKKISQKAHNKLMKSPSKMYALKSNGQKKLEESRHRVSYSKSVMDTGNTFENASPPPPPTTFTTEVLPEVMETAEEKEISAKRRIAAKNKNEFRNQLIDIVNSVWTSDKNLGGLEGLHTYRTPAGPPLNPITENLE